MEDIEEEQEYDGAQELDSEQDDGAYTKTDSLSKLEASNLDSLLKAIQLTVLITATAAVSGVVLVLLPALNGLRR